MQITGDLDQNRDLHFRAANQPCVVFHADGRIEFGEKYRDNPDAAAQEFMRIVRETWPELRGK